MICLSEEQLAYRLRAIHKVISWSMMKCHKESLSKEQNQAYLKKMLREKNSSPRQICIRLRMALLIKVSLQEALAMET